MVSAPTTTTTTHLHLYSRITPTELLPPGVIEHTTLPSGMHLLETDLIAFSHEGLPGAGLFRGRTMEGEGAGRGRRMGTLGVVLGAYEARRWRWRPMVTVVEWAGGGNKGRQPLLD